MNFFSWPKVLLLHGQSAYLYLFASERRLNIFWSFEPDNYSNYRSFDGPLSESHRLSFTTDLVLIPINATLVYLVSTTK